MKLRNKNTGDIWEFDEGFSMKASHETAERAGAASGFLTCYADSLAELNEEWEDYKPAEPLIKDEKVCKAVRAWYDAIDYRIDKLLCIKGIGSTRLEISDGTSKLIYISLFVEKGTLDKIKDRTYYTIAELCGEEEE